MHTPVPATRLLPRQIRLIHAKEGLRLRVVSGRLWLTQPHAAQDLFLRPGDCIDLRQDWVVIGADAEPRPDDLPMGLYSAFELHPLVVPSRPEGRLRAVKAVTAWLRQRLAPAVGPASTGVPTP